MRAAKDFFDDKRKTEIINGQTVLMARPVTNHNTVELNLATIFKNFLKGGKCRVFTETTVTLEEEKNEFIPDIAVVCDSGKIKQKAIYGAPDLVVEILSPSTQKRDKNEKKAVYERCGVREYWIVSPNDRFIDVYLPNNGKLEYNISYASFHDYEYECLSDEEKSKVIHEFSPYIFNELKINVDDVFEDTI